MKIEILVFGNELLDGRRLDTNSHYLGGELTRMGVPPFARQTVQDDLGEMVLALKMAMGRADIVITTGGLGPTLDDLTFEAVANAMERKLVFHEALFARIKERFEKRKLPCPDSNKRQATLPEGAIILDNEKGTAPGIRLDTGKGLIFCLPGIPGEMKYLFEKYVSDFIASKAGKDQQRRRSLIYQFSGMPESTLEEKVVSILSPLQKDHEFSIAFSASFPVIEVVLFLAEDSSTGPEGIQKVDKEVSSLFRENVSENFLKSGSDPIEVKVIELLRQAGQNIAIAESVTGGMICDHLINVSGSSEVLERGYISYSNDSKIECLGVDPKIIEKEGAVSEACALAMAKGAKKSAKTQWGLASTGIAGPTGATNGKPLGLTYLSWVGPNVEKVSRYQFRWDRNRNRMQAALEALKGLKELLIDQRNNTDLDKKK